MRNFLSLLLGATSFICVLYSLNIPLSFINSLDILPLLTFAIFIVLNYFIFYIPATGVILASKGSKWPIIALYILQTLVSFRFTLIIISIEGFALFYIIPYASIGLYALGSIFKILSEGSSYQRELKELEQIASLDGLSAEEFLSLKLLLDKRYAQTSLVGFVILLASIVVSLFVIFLTT